MEPKICMLTKLPLNTYHYIEHIPLHLLKGLCLLDIRNHMERAHQTKGLNSPLFRPTEIENLTVHKNT